MKYRIAISAICLAFTACTGSPHSPAQVVNNGSNFYGREEASRLPHTQTAQTNKSTAGATEVLSSTNSASGSQYYYAPDTSATTPGGGAISSRDITAGSSPPASNSAIYSSVTSAPASGNGRLQWKNQETELEKSYKDQGSNVKAPPQINPLADALERESSSALSDRQNTPPEKVSQDATNIPEFVWPATGKVIAKFGDARNGETNNGINIALPEGTSVQAAANGTVIYAGSELEGYGNIVILKHGDGWYTTYAHNQSITVKKGESVKQGQVVAISGASGNVSEAQLHFSIRKRKAPQDPLKLLRENTSLGKGGLNLG